MKIKLFAFLILMAGLSTVSAQLNAYKYVIVPKHFDVFNKPNQYTTSTLLKHMLTERGFPVIYDDEMPSELINDRCLGTWVDLEDNSNLFRTKVVVVFKNCEGKEVYRTIEGNTKEKGFKDAYHYVIREALHSLDGRKYKYEGDTSMKPIKINFKNDVKSLEEDSKEEEVAPETIEEQQQVLTTIAAKGGYKVVNESNTTQFTLKTTSISDLFLVEKEGETGIMYKKDGKWFLEFSKNGKIAIEEIKIKN